ncbi:DUF4129 domain-containing protein [Halorubellus litoreus]|uniref:DUF4129 domain-containing protein n=1 Tax=Halorubellus litoreus TaxID=755308 RepID=A0ABD5V8K9_9EURY
MDSERARVVAVGVVCVLAVAAAAATLAAPAPTDEAPGGGSLQDDGPADEQGEGGDSAADPIGSPGELDIEIGACIPWLYSASFWAVVGGVTIAGWLYARHRQDALAATAYVSVLALPFTFVWLLLSKCGTDENAPQSIVPSDVVATPEGGDATFGILGDAGQFASPTWLVAVVAVVGVGAFALALARDAQNAEDPDERVPDAVEPPEAHDVDELREAAGRAADRIEGSAGVDNEIYRAWVEMTEHLDVDHPDASTPGEFRRAAVDAGVDPATVGELTDLFERVRYGDEPPTEETEARAVDALRRMEASASDLDDFWTEDEST